MNIYKYLTFFLLGSFVVSTYLTRRLVNEVKAIQSKYTWATGEVIVIDKNVWMLVRGVDLETGDVVNLRINNVRKSE